MNILSLNFVIDTEKNTGSIMELCKFQTSLILHSKHHAHAGFYSYKNKSIL